MYNRKGNSRRQLLLQLFLFFVTGRPSLLSSFFLVVLVEGGQYASRDLVQEPPSSICSWCHVIHSRHGHGVQVLDDRVLDCNDALHEYSEYILAQCQNTLKHSGLDSQEFAEEREE